jgi:hypothetical protein
MLSFVSLADTTVRNGGKIVICENEPHRLLDYIKAEDDWVMKVNLPEGEDEFEVISKLLKRLETYNEGLAKEIQNEASTFYENARFYKDYRMFDIPINDQVGIPVGCEMVLAINQKKPFYSQEKRYRINENIWKEIGPQDKAGLIIHEILIKIYEDFNIEIKNDEHIYFNSLLGSDFQTIKNYRRYLEIVKFLRLPLFNESHDLVIDTRSQLRTYGEYDQTKSVRQGQVVYIRLNYKFGGKTSISAAYEKGRIRYTPDNKDYIYMTFYPTGELFYVYLNDDFDGHGYPRVYLQAQNKTITVSRRSLFYKNGSVRLAVLNKEAKNQHIITLDDTEGTTHELTSDKVYYVEFNEKGEIIRFMTEEEHSKSFYKIWDEEVGRY